MRPLVVDLDGTFLKTDVLWESFLVNLKKDPKHLWTSSKKLTDGRAAFKQQLIDQTKLSLDQLPVSQEIIDFIRDRKASGHKIILATGSTLATAKKIERLYPLFDEVLATGEGTNLTGDRKARELEKRFGREGFDYIGNSLVDLRVWTRSYTAFFHNSHWLTRGILQMTHPRAVAIGKSQHSTLWTVARAIRIHQWPKNFLLVVPFLAAHSIFTWDTFAYLFRGFAVFCLTASSAYLINDLWDIEHDRHHPTKRHRPLAAGHISIPATLGVLLVFASATLWLLQSTSPIFATLLLGYFALTCLYSAWIKRVVLLDVITLAGLYVWRLLAGGALMSIELSRWFLVFSIFLFFSLALVKRYAEMISVQSRGEELTEGRDYDVSDLTLVSQIGTASGLISAVVYCLYVSSPEVLRLYHHSGWLWLGLPLMIYWICRVWMLAGRGKIHEDPVLFTLKDPTSYLIGAFMAFVIVLAK